MGDYVLRLSVELEIQCTHTANSAEHIIILLLILLWLATYYNTSDEVDGHWKQLLHLLFTEFGSSGWSRQVVTKFFKAIHHLFL